MKTQAGRGGSEIRALTALAENLALVPSTHMDAHSHL